MSGSPRLLIFGHGYLGAAVRRRLGRDGWTFSATARAADKRAALAAEGVEALDPADGPALARAFRGAAAVLVTAPPDAQGCPGLRALEPALAGGGPAWIGYVSSTSVYGDRGGGWVFEDGELNAPTVEGARRAAAERAWQAAGASAGLCVCVLRLPSIYGPGRSVVDRLREGTARLVRKPGQVFNRIHVDDAADGVAATIARPRPGAVYNLTDDEPAGADVVLAQAAAAMGLPLPPEVDWTHPEVSEAMRRFYLDSKRVSNALAKAELGWRPAHPTWREGLEALLAE